MTNPTKQYIYVLKLNPALYHPHEWTQEEEEFVSRHFSNLQELLAEGKLILAGKTGGIDNEKTFGIVILEVETEDEALAIMNNDPAVAAGVMTAELFPYRVALIRK